MLLRDLYHIGKIISLKNKLINKKKNPFKPRATVLYEIQVHID